jgi:hypothetical protein
MAGSTCPATDGITGRFNNIENPGRLLPTTAIVAVPARGNDAEKAPAAFALD